MTVQSLLLKISTFISSLLLSNGEGRAPVVKNNGTTVPEGEPIDTFFSAIWSFIVSIFRRLGEKILYVLATLVYLISRLILNIIDFFMVFILEFSGQIGAMDLKRAGSLEETDVIFRFIFNDTVKKISLSIFIISLILLIIFTIFALVKNEYQQFIEKDAKPKTVWQILSRTFLSLFMMFIVPIISILGIVAANVVLVSAVNIISEPSATNFSLGSTIFQASTFEANQYRNYAISDKKIPILFDYNGGFSNVSNPEITLPEKGSTTAIEDEMQSLAKSSVLYKGWSTFQMFVNEDFYSLSGIEQGSAYYEIYDGPYLQTTSDEYWVMADFIDFALGSGEKVYFVNTEEVYRQAKTALDYYGDVVTSESLQQVIDAIVAKDTSGDTILMTDYYDRLNDIDYFEFSVNYTDGDRVYRSLKGATDEAEGAVYLICVKQQYTESGDFFYYPIRQNMTRNGVKFHSDYLVSYTTEQKEQSDIMLNDSMFVARGVFDGDNYPTAIREEGKYVVFYRHQTTMPSYNDFKPIIQYIEPGNAFKIMPTSFTEWITGVDIGTIIPNIDFRFDSLAVFGKDFNSVCSLENGEFKLTYNFTFGRITISNIYMVTKLNLFILVFASIIIFQCLFKVIMGLIKRIFELTLLWISMPAFASTYPMEDASEIGSKDSRFGKWKEEFVGRIFGFFNIYIMWYLIIRLTPIVMQTTIIPADVVTTGLAETNIFRLLPTSAIDFLIKTLFVLVLYTMLNDPSGLLENLTGSKTNMAKEGAGVIGGIKDSVSMSANVFSGKIVFDKAKETFGMAKSLAPDWGAIGDLPANRPFANRIRNNRHVKKFEKTMAEATRAFGEGYAATSDPDYAAKNRENSLKKATPKPKK